MLNILQWIDTISTLDLPFDTIILIFGFILLCKIIRKITEKIKRIFR